jgi:hypothetical protein
MNLYPTTRTIKKGIIVIIDVKIYAFAISYIIKHPPTAPWQFPVNEPIEETKNANIKKMVCVYNIIVPIFFIDSIDFIIEYYLTRRKLLKLLSFGQFLHLSIFQSLELFQDLYNLRQNIYEVYFQHLLHF